MHGIDSVAGFASKAEKNDFDFQTVIISIVTYAVVNRIVCVRSKFFEASLIFVCKARSLTIYLSTILCSTWVGSCFPRKYLTSLKTCMEQSLLLVLLQSHICKKIILIFKVLHNLCGKHISNVVALYLNVSERSSIICK